MPEREKVIEELKELHSHFRALAGIASSQQTRANHIESARIIRDAIDLLKAQEPVEPILIDGTKYVYCGSCKRPLCLKSDEDIPAYCSECGKAVKGDA